MSRVTVRSSEAFVIGGRCAAFKSLDGRKLRRKLAWGRGRVKATVCPRRSGRVATRRERDLRLRHTARGRERRALRREAGPRRAGGPWRVVAGGPLEREAPAPRHRREVQDADAAVGLPRLEGRGRRLDRRGRPTSAPRPTRGRAVERDLDAARGPPPPGAPSTAQAAPRAPGAGAGRTSTASGPARGLEPQDEAAGPLLDRRVEARPPAGRPARPAPSPTAAAAAGRGAPGRRARRAPSPGGRRRPGSRASRSRRTAAAPRCRAGGSRRPDSSSGWRPARPVEGHPRERVHERVAGPRPLVPVVAEGDEAGHERPHRAHVVVGRVVERALGREHAGAPVGGEGVARERLERPRGRGRARGARRPPPWPATR